MILDQAMRETLQSIKQIEDAQMCRALNVPIDELGNSLIAIYYSTSHLKTRKLIWSFMLQAGAVWQRKLLTNDTSPIASSATRFATLNDYVALLLANDDTGFGNLAVWILIDLNRVYSLPITCRRDKSLLHLPFSRAIRALVNGKFAQYQLPAHKVAELDCI